MTARLLALFAALAIGSAIGAAMNLSDVARAMDGCGTCMETER